MNQPKRRSLSSYVFASFFGAAMVASAFAYFNFKFSEYKFIDFSELIFYEKSDIFTPKESEYIVVIFSSNMQTVEDIESYHKEGKILAIDLYQKRFESSEKVIFISSGINTLLEFVQKFNIYSVPSAFILKRDRESRYKQDSSIQRIELR